MTALANSRREEVQHLPRQGRRQGDGRRRGPQDPQDLDAVRAPPGSLGGEQGGRQGRRAGAASSWSSCATRPPRSSASRTTTPCMLYLNEQNGDDLIKLFDELDELTREPFQKAKAEIDVELAKQCERQGRGADALALSRPVLPGSARRSSRPTSTRSTPSRTSSSCAGTSTAASACPSTWSSRRRATTSRRRKGKNPHAFCTDITRDGTDVRVLANIVPQRILDGDHAARVRPFGLQQHQHPREAALRAAHRGAHPDHRRRGHDVREAVEAPRLAGEDGRQGRRSRRRSTRPAPRCCAISC